MPTGYYHKNRETLQKETSKTYQNLSEEKGIKIFLKKKR